MITNAGVPASRPNKGGFRMENKNLIEAFKAVYTSVALTITAVIFLIPALTA